MSLRNSLLLMLTGLVFATARGQQLPQGSLYVLNPFVVNPAFSGLPDYADLRLSYRRQWQGLDDAPHTGTLTFHTPVGYGDRVSKSKLARTPRYADVPRRPVAPPGSRHFGVGAVLLSDRTGPTDRHIVQLTGAAHFSLPGDWQLSAGLGAGVLQYTLRFDDIQTAQPNDPLILSGRATLLKLYLSTGLLVQKNNFWAAASVLAPNAPSLAYDVPVGKSAEARLRPHYFMMAGYRLALSDELALIPQVCLKAVGGAPLTAEGQVRIQYANRLWAGLHYRRRDSLGALLGLALSADVTVSYAYEYPLSVVSAVASGSHELLLGFRFNNRAAVYCPPMGW